MPKHTPEPWLINDGFHVIAETPRGKYAHAFVAECDETDATEEEAEANASRIVACVNGCAGIPTKALQDGIIQAMRQTIFIAEHHRSGENDTNDEGLKALRRMAGLLRTRSDGRCAVCPLAYESTAPCACYETAPG